MNTTRDSAEQLALRGLLMRLVEVQNIIRSIGPTIEEVDPFLGLEQIEDLLESAATQELIQLARAALQTPKQTAIPAAAAGLHE